MKSDTVALNETAVAEDSLGPWPLMRNNISRADLDAVIEFLGKDDPILTQSENVRAFEKEWSEWLGVDYSVFVNSGASANLLTMSALKYIYGPGEVIVPSLTWVSDIASVIQSGLKPVFVDIDPFTLGMDTEQVLDKLNSRTRAVFLTHTLGYNALNDKLLDELKAGGVPLIEDVCESHGATYNNKKLGAFGWISNFSFYYAHHLSTIEGGMVCTSDPEVYYIVRMLRSHGMVRESGSLETKTRYRVENPDLNPDFIFAYPAYNMRNTEINAVIGRNQLKRLNENNRKRTRNLHIFLEHLDAERFQTCFNTAGSSNYAFTLILNAPDLKLRNRIEKELRENKVEFRRGTAGGGNQLRQPYLRRIFGDIYKNYPAVDHVHFFGWYIGNYPDLEEERIIHLCRLLNGV